MSISPLKLESIDDVLHERAEKKISGGYRSTQNTWWHLAATEL